MIGRTLSHYEITGKLGAGGMGEVYLARDLTLERQVALKVLPEDVAGDATLLKRLQREAKALAALDHPNIVTVFSVEQDEGVHFLTMGYVEGRTLNELIPSEGMPVEDLLDHAIALADALRAAHERGIIHRDLKPSNVMVDKEGRLRVLDFGLARRDETVPVPGDQPTQKVDDPVTSRGVVMGTIPYMSPEQAEGRLLDARSDLFSLGTVLYEMATGSRPFSGETPASLISSILRDTPSSVTEVRPPLPEPLGPIIERCLEKAPEKRYQSARELREELEALRREVLSGSVASPTGGRPSLRSRPGTLTAVALLVLIIAVAGTLTWRSREAPAVVEPREVAPASDQIRSIAVLPLRNLSGDPEQEYFVDGMTEELITNLSKIGALTVIARSSSRRFKDTDTPLSDICEALGVDAVVEGSVAREGDQVRISAQLIDAASERVLWGEQYRRDLRSVLELQAEVATAIATQILTELTPEEATRLGKVRQYDPAAYDDYLNGQFHRQKLTPSGLDTAMRYFESALEKDPSFALAYYGINSVWGSRQQMGFALPSEAGPKKKAALLKALELDDELVEAHGGMAGHWTWTEWNWEKGEEAFRRAIELDPNRAQTRSTFSHLLNITGRPDEAMEQIERAVELDPLNPVIRGFYGVDLMFLRRYDDAIVQFQEALDTSPTIPFVLAQQSTAHFLKGELAESWELEVRVAEARRDDVVKEALERGYEKGGYTMAMREAAEAAIAQGSDAFSRPIQVATFYRRAGDYEASIDWLEKAYEIHDPNMPYLGLPGYDVLRGNPRFQELVRRMNLPSRTPDRAEP